MKSRKVPSGGVKSNVASVSYMIYYFLFEFTYFSDMLGFYNAGLSALDGFILFINSKLTVVNLQGFATLCCKIYSRV